MFFVLIAVVMLISSVFPVKAEDYILPSQMRIGLSGYNEKDSITILSPSIIFGYHVYGQPQRQSGALYSANGFTVRPYTGVCVVLPQNYGSGLSGFEQARQAASTISTSGISAGAYVPACAEGGNWFVYGISYSTIDNASSDASRLGGSVSFAVSERITLSAGNTQVIFETRFQIIEAEAGTVSLTAASGSGSVQYRGAIEFGRYNGQKISAVNVLSMDEYLYSVVAGEMTPSWNIEALKAQAVAARSYTLNKIMSGSVHTENSYDLCDGTHCQYYRGTVAEALSTTRAVDETSGIVAYYDGLPINAVYHSSSGGVTESSENAWVTAVPYLRSVSDPYEYEPSVWTRTFTLNDLTALLSKNNHNIGSATGMYIGGYNPSGRVASLIITGERGQVTLTKEGIRTFFSSSAGGSLNSTNFTLNGVGSGNSVSSGSTTSGTSSPVFVSVFDGRITLEQPISDLFVVSVSGAVSPLLSVTASNGVFSVVYESSTQNVVTQPAVPPQGSSSVFVFSGSGWGHGVGMSQRGAEGMARMGYDYRSILTHYYTGITIKSVEI